MAAACFAATLAWPGLAFPGFFLLSNAVVPTTGLYSWTGFQRGVPYLARVTSVDGTPTATARAIYAHVEALPVGTVVHYTFEKDGLRSRSTSRRCASGGATGHSRSG